MTRKKFPWETKEHYEAKVAAIQKVKKYSDALDRLKTLPEWKTFVGYIDVLISAKKDQLAEIVAIMNPSLSEDSVEKSAVEKQLMIYIGVKHLIQNLENEGIACKKTITELLTKMEEVGDE